MNTGILSSRHKRHTAEIRLRPFDPITGDIVVGVLEDGRPAVINVSNQSGVVVGGVPGSGKTAGMMLIVLSLLLSGITRVHVIDGKGGADWRWASTSGLDYSTDDTDAALSMLKRMHLKLRERLTSLPDEYGTSNWWNIHSRQRPPLEVIVIDECQLWLDLRHLTDLSKEHKEKCSTILSLATDLVRRGRSAGFILFVLTQKPTADSLPTNLRDNCGTRICFRVLTAEAGRAVLGDLPTGAPDPTTIPASRRGGAVITTDSGMTSMCRFAYMPEGEAERLICMYRTDASKHTAVINNCETGDTVQQAPSTRSTCAKCQGDLFFR